MAGVTALRDEARAAIFAAGGRGFVRFCAEGDALLVSDVPRWGDGEVLVRALEDAGFACTIRGSLLLACPTDERLLTLCASQPQAIAIDWESPHVDAMALAARLLREAPIALEESGRGLVIRTARLLWQPKEKVLPGLSALRAQIAMNLREGKRSGLHETGRLLCGWLHENQPKGGRGDEA